MAARWWPAPAKLNLFLHITGRRADGYHALQTAFQFLDHADELRFLLRDDGRILRDNAIPGVDVEHDLNIRAARLLQAACPTTARGVSIAIRKRIPMGGGLGGGSSNAATTLLVLNRLWGCGLDAETLAGLGLRLGADVPVFVHGRAAWAEGVGERLQAIEPPEPWYLVVGPGCEVSTAEIFSAPDLTRDTSPTTISRFLAGGVIDNDCLSVVLKRYPEVRDAMDWLSGYADPRMTGTGASLFAEFADRGRAEQCLERLPDRFSGFVARGANTSLLHRQLSEAADG
ncbi:MAG TPA: 4-(cytidine 5'-diphospho)-2-C-methyl-D-erythritol kinase [Chromatiaceae bacterium]|nr:4-(cytidine 5'-diphospho)-2-C-methyl-D-erythritol kinase [Chromatiaceae bacterium]